MKKLAILVAVFALTLGLAQCKKEQPATPQSEGNGVMITLNVDGGNDNGSRVQVDPPHVAFEDGDQILVASNGSYVGTLTRTDGTFSGSISDPVEGQPLYFYFLGNKQGTLSTGATTCTVNISDQTSELPVISMGKSTVNYASTVTAYSSKLYNKASLMKFNVTTPSTAAICITGMNNEVTVDFADPTDNGFTYGKDGDGLIKMPAKDASNVTWAIVLPQGALAEGAEGSAYTADNAYTGTRPAMAAIAMNTYLDGGFDLSITAAVYTLLSAATTSDYGKVVCAAGHLHAAKTALPTGCTAVGILGKVTETGCGLILALKDATSQDWNTINGWTSVTTYAGTTLKVLPDDAAHGSLTSYTALGTTAVSDWAVAQKSDYMAIFTNLGSTTGDYEGKTYDANVNAYITTGVGGDAITGDYWSATKFIDGYASYFKSDNWTTNGMSVSLSVRPVLGFGGEVTLLSAATAEDVGKVVCADGHLRDAKTAVPPGCTAVGILGKVTETGHGLILALQDATSQTWNTINGWTSTTDFAGTTLKLLPDDAARGANLTSYTTLGSTAVSNWAVAQKSDYEAIFTNLGSTTGNSNGKTYDANVNAYITTGVGGTAIPDYYYYWSATAFDGDGDCAWNFRSDGWGSSLKTYSDAVRPVLGF